MQDFKKEIEKYIQNNQIDRAFEEINKLIAEDNTNSDLYILRADLYYRQQKFSEALNDYIKVLKTDNENKTLKSKVELIKEILKFEALDIYASTNLNNDPWLD